MGDNMQTTGLGCAAPPNEEVAGSEDRGKVTQEETGTSAGAG